MNGEDFAKSPNTSQFLLGDRPSWSLAGANIPFTRDIEDEVWDEVLEAATSPGARSKAVAVLASAGIWDHNVIDDFSGEDRNGANWSRVHAARWRGGPRGNVEFAATTSLGTTCYFFIDEAREHAMSLNTALARQRQSRSSSLFVIGENERTSGGLPDRG